MKTFLFYDIETTGFNKAFDQVIQFAAIRTDENFNEIEQKEILIKLRKDIVPSPGAIITHRISIPDLLNGECEYDAIKSIHGMLNKPGTISLGYNTLGFDDEFLRFAFYRNLLTPYTHQYANGCSRMDLFPMVVMYRLYRKQVLQWPELNNKVSLKLENLSDANNLAKGPAHDAMVDVKATVALAKILFREKEMWQYLTAYFDKSLDQERVARLPETFQSQMGIHTLGLIHSGEFGADLNYMAPYIYIGNSIPYSNQSLWLRLDQPELKKTTEATLKENTWVSRKRFGEPGFILPPEERFWKNIGNERDCIVRENIDWLKNNPELFSQIIIHYRKFKYEMIPELDIDAALYQNGFLSNSEQAKCKKFHQATFQGRLEMVNEFSDTVTRRLAKRLLHRNFHEDLDEDYPEEYLTYLKKTNPEKEEDALVDYKGKIRFTPALAILEIEKIKDEISLDEQQTLLLEELRNYLENNFGR